MEEKKKHHLSLTIDNLAMPEIHTGRVEDEPDEDSDSPETAVPETHFSRKKSDQKA